MASLSQAKTFGGVGSVLVLLTPIPYAGWVIGIAGFVLTLLAIKNISDFYQDDSIFNNMLISVVLAIVGVVIGGLVVIGAIFSMFGLHALSGSVVSTPTVSSGFFATLGALIAGLAVIWIVFIISAYLLRKSYNSIATKTQHWNVQDGCSCLFHWSDPHNSRRPGFPLDTRCPDTVHHSVFLYSRDGYSCGRRSSRCSSSTAVDGRRGHVGARRFDCAKVLH